MSWKRIFRTARKVGAPVIIADEDGKKPQVILPLDVYEALIDESFDSAQDFQDFEIDEIPEFVFEDDEEMDNRSYDVTRGYSDTGEIERGKNDNLKQVSPGETAAPAFEFEDSLETDGVESLNIPEFEGLNESPEENEGKEEEKQKFSKPSEEMDVEDRFYFEPIDDEDEKD
jgi:hypothetical protein